MGGNGNMIVFFPDPYPDELLYSVCARYTDIIGYPGSSSANQELFGRRGKVASVDLPMNLGYLVANLPPGHHYTEDQIIDENTLLPFYAPFCPAERISSVRIDMKYSNSSQAHARLGIFSQHTPQWLQFCPLCVLSDRQKFGEPYWHRLHQVPGVKVCPIHNVFLEQSAASVRKERQCWEFISASRAIETTQPRLLQQKETYIQKLIKIACDVAWLLSQRNLAPSEYELRNRYLHLLAKQGFATYKGYIYFQVFMSAFRDFYTHELLQEIKCDLDLNSYHNWLMRIIRSPLSQAQNPLHHLLIIHFLGYSLSDFFQLPSEFYLFGKGPWPCLNAASDHFQKPVIQNCHIKYFNGRKPVATFTCNCGFVYSRSGPLESENDKYKIGRIIDYGHVWLERFTKLWLDSTISIRQIARELGVGYQALKFRAYRLGLPLKRSKLNLELFQSSQLSSADNKSQKLAKPTTSYIHRLNFLKAIEQYPSASRTFLQDNFVVPYRWLKANDCEWLDAHLPPAQHFLKHKGIAQVDWSNRDIELEIAVRSSALSLKNSTGRPIWLTKTAITKRIGIRKLVSDNQDKLPLTVKALNELVETQPEYAVRRLWWATNCFQSENICPIKGQLLLRASLKPATVALPWVKVEIDKALEILSHIDT
jgi:Tn7-like transposition protein D/TniQ